jgi:hypothetical protein
MPRKLKRFPEPKRRGKYPWEEWLDGSVWLLRHGEDYETSSASMRAIATSAAKTAGKRLRTQVTEDDDGTEALVIQAFDSAQG